MLARSLSKLAAGGTFAAAFALFAGTAAHSTSAQVIDATITSPTLDRWMYPFNNNASVRGSETEGRVFSPFGSGLETSFDNHDGQFLIGWDTASLAPTGRGLNGYRVLGATLTLRTSRELSFTYDPTPDSYRAYLQYVAPGDPEAITDDLGQPVEVYAVGYRNGFAAIGPTAFAENSPFSFSSPFPSVRQRNSFAAQYQNLTGAGGSTLIDISNNVLDRFESVPFAVGQAPLAPGVLVPIDTDFTFELDTRAAGAQRYLRSALDLGRLNLMVTSLAITTQQSAEVAAFYTKEFAAGAGGVPPKLTIRICPNSTADWDCSGTVNADDIFKFLGDWFLADGSGDFDLDGQSTADDIFAFLGLWFANL